MYTMYSLFKTINFVDYAFFAVLQKFRLQIKIKTKTKKVAKQAIVRAHFTT